MFPSEIKVKEKKYLCMKWNDGTETTIKLANIRINCPCAVCSKERKDHGSKYIPIYSDAQLKIESIEMVGNYAVAISWSDDHDTGIFDFNYLKNLSSTKG